MRKLILFFVIAIPASAGAEAPAAGCARLASIVFDSVIEASTGKPGASARATGGIETCAAAAATTSRAYTSAMARLNVGVSWQGPMNPGDYCASHDLRQCYPEGGSGPWPGLPGEYRFVTDSWRAVRWSVLSRTQFGGDGDVIVYDPVELRRSLALAMPSTNFPAYAEPDLRRY